MSFSTSLRSAASTCRYSGNKTGLTARDRPECGRTYNARLHRMVNLANSTAISRNLNEAAFRTALTHPAKSR